MKYVGSYGPESASIMIVGEAPGEREEIEGRPFVGPAGNLLRKFVSMVGIDLDQVFLTNICKYRPPGNKIRAWFDNQGAPNQTVLLGMMELQEEIEQVRPNVIVACGNYPLKVLTNLARWRKVKQRDGATIMDYTGISNWRGSIVECSLVEGRKVIPTYHPSFINREGYDFHGIFSLDLERVKYESDFPEIRLPQKELIIDPQGSDRWHIRDRLLDSSTEIISLDIEYIGSELLCVGLTNSRDWAASVRTNRPADFDFVREVLLSGKPLCAQNAIYDCSILEWHYKMPVMQYIKYDTMLAAHASNIELPKGLDFLASIYTDQRYYKDMINWEDVRAGRQPISDVLRYNCIDVWVTHEVMEEQLKHDLCDPEIMRTFRFEMSLLQPLWEVSMRGVRVDREKIDSLRSLLVEEIDVRMDALMLVAGKPVNVKSRTQVSELLFDKLGLKPTKLNKTGPATDDKTLAEVQLNADTDLQRNVIQLIRDIRYRRDLISKFVDVQFDEDNRMRGHYDPAGTDTGRLASRKFYPTGTGGNQQNIHRDSRVRSVFLPDHEPD